MGDSILNKDGKSYDCPGEDRGYAFEEVNESKKRS